MLAAEATLATHAHACVLPTSKSERIAVLGIGAAVLAVVEAHALLHFEQSRSAHGTLDVRSGKNMLLGRTWTLLTRATEALKVGTAALTVACAIHFFARLGTVVACQRRVVVARPTRVS